MSQPTHFLIVTEREGDILRELLRDGATNEMIGRRLYITVDTVKTHMKRLMAKAGVHTRTELAVQILRRDIIVVHKVRDDTGVDGIVCAA